MSLTSLIFIEFLIGVIIAYFILPKKYQWVVILVANIIFYASGGVKYLLYVLFTTVATFFGAILFENINLETKERIRQAEGTEAKRKIREASTSRKKKITFAIVFVVMGVWVTIKYGNFVIDNLNILFRNLHIDYKIAGLSLVMPLGMSFYTFQAVGYMIDIYRSKYPAQRNFLKYATFVSYFPHILQGPFSRYDVLGKSIIEEHSFDYDRLCSGSARIIWGFFKKIVIADQIGISVNAIFDDYTSYTGFNIMCVIFMYAIQIYADFSGYMDIVCGFSNILGIELQENFNQPYFAKSIDEFWRRWHMTLSQWFRDYMFYPISMSKNAQRMGKTARKFLGNKWGRLLPSYFALIFVWTCTGLWHGANWTYLIWGYLNFIVIVCGMHWAEYYRKAREFCHIKEGNPIWEGFRIVRTFALVAVFRFFSVADSVSIAVGMIKRIFTNFDLMKTENIFPGIANIPMAIMIMGAVTLVIVDLLREKDHWENIKRKTPPILRAMIYAIMLLLIFLVIPVFTESGTGDFMYANF